MKKFVDIVVGFLLFSTSASVALADQKCDRILALVLNLDLAQGAELKATQGSKTYKKLYHECDTTDSFAGKALPKFQERQLKCSTDRNNVEFVRKFPDGITVFRGKMSVDADGSPASMGPDHSPTDQPQTWLTFDSGSKTHFANAEDVPFIVVPLTKPSAGVAFMADTGVGKGDLAVAVANGKCSFGVVGDAGPYFRLGEGSIRTHADLGNPQCAVPNQYPCKKLRGGGSGRGIPAGVTYILFPDTRPVPLLSQTVVGVSLASASDAAVKFLKKFQK